MSIVTEGKITCTGRSASATTHGVERGVDVSFALTIPVGEGVEEIAGSCTLAPRQFDGAMAAYGASADMWIDGRTVARIRDLATRDFRDALDAIEQACAPIAAAFADEST